MWLAGLHARRLAHADSPGAVHTACACFLPGLRAPRSVPLGLPLTHTSAPFIPHPPPHPPHTHTCRGRRVALDVACALNYLHSATYTHFDVKARNVLLSRDLTAKLADVGFARWGGKEVFRGRRCGGAGGMGKRLPASSRSMSVASSLQWGAVLSEEGSIACAAPCRWRRARAPATPLLPAPAAPMAAQCLLSACLPLPPPAGPCGPPTTPSRAPPAPLTM